MTLHQRQTFHPRMDVEGREVLNLLNEVAGVCFNVTKMDGYTDQGITINHPEQVPAQVGVYESPETMLGGTGESAQTDTWDRANPDSGDDGVTVTIQVRTVYDDTSGEILYGYSRDFTFDSLGALAEISLETRYTIDTPDDDCT